MKLTAFLIGLAVTFFLGAQSTIIYLLDASTNSSSGSVGAVGIFLAIITFLASAFLFTSLKLSTALFAFLTITSLLVGLNSEYTDLTIFSGLYAIITTIAYIALRRSNQ